MKKRRIAILAFVLTLLLIMTACALPGCLFGGEDQVDGNTNDGQATDLPLGDTGGDGTSAIRDLSGSWGGLLTETNGTQRNMDVLIFHAERASEWSGNLSITSLDGSMFENYDITGTFDGTTIRFIAPGEVENRNFWATVSGDTLSGMAAWGCYDCQEQAWGQFDLTYGVITSGAEIGAPPALPADFDISGTWTGTLVQDDNPGQPLDMRMEVSRDPTTEEFYGSLTITLPASEYQEFYLVIGTIVNGITFTFHDSGTEVITHYFWGNISDPNLIYGWGSLICSECMDQTYAAFSLNR